MSYLMEQIGASLRKARKEKNLSQKEVSKYLGIPQSHISKIEGGLVDLRTSSLVHFAQIVGLDMMLIPSILEPLVKMVVKGERPNENEQIPFYRLEAEDE